MARQDFGHVVDGKELTHRGCYSSLVWGILARVGLYVCRAPRFGSLHPIVNCCPRQQVATYRKYILPSMRILVCHTQGLGYVAAY